MFNETQLEAIEADAEHLRKGKLQQWQQQMDELQQLLAGLPEARPLFGHMIELIFEGCQEMPTSQERIDLIEKINEKRKELRAPLDQELDALAEKMIGLSAPEKQVEIRNAMAYGTASQHQSCWPPPDKSPSPLRHANTKSATADGRS